MISIFQTYHNEESKSFLDSAFYPYCLHAQDELREYKLMREVYEMNPALKKGITYLGVTDCKFSERTNITGEEIISRIKTDIEDKQEKDVYLYCSIDNMKVYPIYGAQQKLEGTLPNYYMPDIDINLRWMNEQQILPVRFFEKYQYSVFNYWIAKREVFDDYCKNWLLPAMDFFKREKTTNFYPALELLFGCFLANSNYSFEYLVKKRYTGMKKPQWVKVETDSTQKQQITKAA